MEEYVVDECVFCEVPMIQKPFSEVYECPRCGSIAYDNDEDETK